MSKYQTFVLWDSSFSLEKAFILSSKNSIPDSSFSYSIRSAVCWCGHGVGTTVCRPSTNPKFVARRLLATPSTSFLSTVLQDMLHPFF